MIINGFINTTYKSHQGILHELTEIFQYAKNNSTQGLLLRYADDHVSIFQTINMVPPYGFGIFCVLNVYHREFNHVDIGGNRGLLKDHVQNKTMLVIRSIQKKFIKTLNEREIQFKLNNLLGLDEKLYIPLIEAWQRMYNELPHPFVFEEAKERKTINDLLKEEIEENIIQNMKKAEEQRKAPKYSYIAPRRQKKSTEKDSSEIIPNSHIEIPIPGWATH